MGFVDFAAFVVKLFARLYCDMDGETLRPAFVGFAVSAILTYLLFLNEILAVRRRSRPSWATRHLRF